ncbi:hypothetical protein [Symbioplanes lichenis]|uniref:hypothetical protein n=1 Tax=Symbioplanes lichenis TaxID=1629072 RepID=UPI002739ED99|nr:hypothetical protein [Actinoplanes lichenis]
MAAPSLPSAPSARAFRALAWREATLLLTAPAVWAGVLLQVVLGVLWYSADEPRWAAFGQEAGLSALVLAGFLLLTSHLAGSRDHRHGAAEGSSVLPASDLRRTGAVLALIPVGGVLGAVALGAELVAASPRWPEGPLSPWSLAMPVLIPMLGAAVGVATSRWWPTTAAGPLTFFGCTALLAMMPVFGQSPQSLSWVLFPVLFDDGHVQAGMAAAEAQGGGGWGVAAWHAGYLAALVAAAAAVAVLRQRRLIPAVVLVLAVAFGLVAVWQQHPDLGPAPGAASPVSGSQP